MKKLSVLPFSLAVLLASCMSAPPPRTSTIKDLRTRIFIHAPTRECPYMWTEETEAEAESFATIAKQTK